MTLENDLAGCRAAHGALVDALRSLTAPDARAASALPGWSVGHVLTHLARNADANRRVALAAGRGEVGAMYASLAQRDADIEAGSGRPPGALVADVIGSINKLEAVWAAVTPETWATGRARGPMGEFPLTETVWRRWREVSVHHGDLAAPFDASALSADYLAADLPRLLADLAGRLDAASGRALAAWLVGRADSPGPMTARPWQAPPAPSAAAEPVPSTAPGQPDQSDQPGGAQGR